MGGVVVTLGINHACMHETGKPDLCGKIWENELCEHDRLAFSMVIVLSVLQISAAFQYIFNIQSVTLICLHVIHVMMIEQLDNLPQYKCPRIEQSWWGKMTNMKMNLRDYFHMIDCRSPFWLYCSIKFRQALPHWPHAGKCWGKNFSQSVKL